MRFSADGAGDRPWDFPRTVAEAAVVLGGPVLVPEAFGSGWVHEIHSENSRRTSDQEVSIQGVTVRVITPLEADFVTTRVPSPVDLPSTVAAVLIGHVMNRSSPLTDVPTVRALSASVHDSADALLLDGEERSGVVVEFGPYEGAAAAVDGFVIAVAGDKGVCSTPVTRMR